jgi:hypothetical protein
VDLQVPFLQADSFTPGLNYFQSKVLSHFHTLAQMRTLNNSLQDVNSFASGTLLSIKQLTI